VAEDNTLSQKVTVAALRRLGHTGVVVADGEKALQCLGQMQFDLLLLDLMMPVMDGLQVLTAIRAMERDGMSHLPILMATANDLPQDRERLILAGADGYVAKPIDVSVLGQEIQRVLGDSSKRS
jgi:CheY-like chemotaxis protein